MDEITTSPTYGLTENLDKPSGTELVGESEKNYDKLMRKYIRAFGSPPRYTKEVDPYYNLNIGSYTGRAMSKTWFSQPAIFSICPGTVDYLPGFSASKKDHFFDALFDTIKDESSEILSKVLKSDNKSGKLYAFKSAYTEYINVVNLLARTASNYLGIGGVTNAIPGSSVPLNKFDYGYYTTPSKSRGKKSIFEETLRALNTAVSDDSYIHFFLNNQGSSASENISTSAMDSYIESQINSGGLSELGRNLEFLFGGAVGAADEDIKSIIDNTGDGFLRSIAGALDGYLRHGGRLVFPKMIDSVEYSKSIAVSMKFTSPYGDKRSIFLRTILPALHLLAIATPKQISDNMYTYPFLCRVYQKGYFNSDLAFINSLEFNRGGPENTSWTTDGLPTEIEATFYVTPLYSSLMMSSAKNPFLFMQNTTLMEYLGTMCGLDLKINNFDTKVDMAIQSIKNRILDIPTNMARGVVDSKLINTARKWTQIIN